MCTLTVVSGSDTYRMAMNRDEKIARGTGMPCEVHEFDGTKAIYPNDDDGGTWIGANECGIALALLNWNDIALSARAVKTRSRGRVIPSLIDSRSQSDMHSVISVSSFTGMLPFRLVGAFPAEQEIWEWRWDSTQLTFQVHEWKSGYWFSSSLSEDRAETLRGVTCRAAQRESDAGSVPWLRRLHASHAGGPGPFSLCVHREDVKTLSYSEIVVTPGHVQVGHFRGSPCTMAQTEQIHAIEMERAKYTDRLVWGVSNAAI